MTADVAEQLGAPTCWCCGAPSTASRCAWAWSGSDRRAAAGLAGRPPGRAAGLGHRLLPDRRRHPGGRRLPALARPRRRRLLRPDRRHRAGRTRVDLAAGQVKALVATSALGMGFDATLGFVVNLGAPQSPVAYYQQVGRAGRGIDEASVVLLPATEDRDIWAYFASLAFPREQLVRQTLEVLAAEGRADEHRRARDSGRALPHPAGDDAQGARRRRRGTPRRRRLDRHRAAVGLRRRALRRGSPRPASASSRRCSTTSPPTGAAWGSCATSSTTRRPRRLRPLRQLRRARRSAASPRRPSARRAPAARPPGRGRRSPARCGRPALAAIGLDLKGKIAEAAERGPGRRPADRSRPRPGAARALPRRRR